MGNFKPFTFPFPSPNSPAFSGQNRNLTMSSYSAIRLHHRCKWEGCVILKATLAFADECGFTLQRCMGYNMALVAFHLGGELVCRGKHRSCRDANSSKAHYAELLD